MVANKNTYTHERRAEILDWLCYFLWRFFPLVEKVALVIFSLFLLLFRSSSLVNEKQQALAFYFRVRKRERVLMFSNFHGTRSNEMKILLFNTCGGFWAAVCAKLHHVLILFYWIFTCWGSSVSGSSNSVQKLYMKISPDTNIKIKIIFKRSTNWSRS